MEADIKHKKKDHINFQKRNPLQSLNRVHSHHKTSSATSIEPPKCLGFLLTSNSSSSSSSGTNSRPFTKLISNASKKSAPAASKSLLRSRENQMPRQLLYQKSRIKEGQLGQSNVNRAAKYGEKSMATSKEGSRYLMERTKKYGKSIIEQVQISSSYNSSSTENCTPMGKLANFNENVTVGEDTMPKIGNCSVTPVKTPPVEASVSPEIQSGSHSKLLISQSGATPVCYGAGYILSGITDKRKCRRRGSLKGGCEKTDIFDDEVNDGNVISFSRDFSVPLLAGASVNWHLSPRDRGYEAQCGKSGNDLEQCGLVSEGDDNDFVTLDLSPSPSSICEDHLSMSVGSLELGELTRLQKNMDCNSSWVSDSMLENSAQPGMRISWRDDIVETEEFDCCRCLTDEEIEGAEELGKADGLDCNVSPIVLDYEPVISMKKKDGLFSEKINMCAESISTNGGSLVASGDSDWTSCFSNNLC